MITIEVDDRRVLDVLNGLIARLNDLTPAMQTIGEYLVGATKRRFVTSTGPDGVPWAPNTETTYLRMLEKAQGVTLKSGQLNKKGANMAMTKKPLVGAPGHLGGAGYLSGDFAPFADRDSITIGSSLVYAAVQQFGAAKGAFGTDRRGHPIPWGRIPPRPFIGLSATDADQVLTIVGEHLAAAAK